MEALKTSLEGSPPVTKDERCKVIIFIYLTYDFCFFFFFCICVGLWGLFSLDLLGLIGVDFAFLLLL